MKPNYLTEEEWQSLYYFWHEKGDITRYVGWLDCKVKLEENNHPLILALNNVQLANMLVNSLLRE